MRRARTIGRTSGTLGCSGIPEWRLHGRVFGGAGYGSQEGEAWKVPVKREAGTWLFSIGSDQSELVRYCVCALDTTDDCTHQHILASGDPPLSMDSLLTCLEFRRL